MSDRYNYLTVILETDLRDDDAEVLISAIKQLRGVLVVKPNVSEPVALLALSRAKDEIRQQIGELLKQ